MKAFIDWKLLKNPVLSYPDWSIKDFACAYKDRVFYLFFSAFYDSNGRVRSHVVEVKTPDFKTFSEPILNFDGQAEGWIGMCSPDLQRFEREYVLTFNSWGDQPGKPNQLFYRTSRDLTRWSDPQPLARNLTEGKRAIDAALTRHGKRYRLVWKDHEHRSRIAESESLNGPFQIIGDGYLQFTLKDNTSLARTHENYQFHHWNKQWYLLTTAYRPHRPFLYQMQGNGSESEHWLSWHAGYELEIPVETFNTEHRANASALYDWRALDGYFYLFYAGNTENERFLKRGWNRLGLARSKDLKHWLPAGEV